MGMYIGIDLGGTNLKMGIVDQSGKLITHINVPTEGKGAPEKAMVQIVHTARDLTNTAGVPWEEIEGVGIGLPGFLDLERGIIKSLTNLFWENIPIRDRLEQEWKKPVRIDNDANVAALGEVWIGAGKGVDNVVCITLGTGVGGGIIVNGGLVHGANNSAGEIGHIVVNPNGVQCNCGLRGCLETISSASGMIRLAKEAISEGKPTTLTQSSEISPKSIFEAAAAGDSVANRVIEQSVDALAEVLSALSVTINPDRFVIGGGVALAGDALLAPLRTAWKKKTVPHAREGTEIVPALLGNDAGMIGAAALFRQRDRK